MAEKSRCTHCGSPDTEFQGNCAPEYPHLDAWWCYTCNDGEFVVAAKQGAPEDPAEIFFGRDPDDVRNAVIRALDEARQHPSGEVPQVAIVDPFRQAKGE